MEKTYIKNPYFSHEFLLKGMREVFVADHHRMYLMLVDTNHRDLEYQAVRTSSRNSEGKICPDYRRMIEKIEIKNSSTYDRKNLIKNCLNDTEKCRLQYRKARVAWKEKLAQTDKTLRTRLKKEKPILSLTTSIEDGTVLVNPKYLLDVLRTTTRDIVTISWSDAWSPIRVYTGRDDIWHVIMPIRP